MKNCGNDPQELRALVTNIAEHYKVMSYHCVVESSSEEFCGNYGHCLAVYIGIV